MAENQEKTEAEILEEAIHDLEVDNTDDILEETNILEKDEILENTQSNNIEDLKDTLEKYEAKDEEEKLVEEINLNNNKEDKSIEKEDLEIEKEISTQKKQGKLQKILINSLWFLSLVILVGAILYFMGIFDSKPIKETKIDKPEEKKEEYKFDSKDIDPNRLNKKLNLLTKYEIVENADIEKEKEEEKEKLYLEAKKQLEEERQAQIEKIKEAERKRLAEELPQISNSKNLEEAIDKGIETVIEKNDEKEDFKEPVISDNEDIKTKEEETIIKEEHKEENIVTETKEENIPDKNDIAIIKEETTPIIEETKEKIDTKMKSFIKVIKISTKEKNIYKSYLDKLLSIDTRVTLCRDDKNYIEIFVGPFENEIERNTINNKYINELKIDAEAYDFTQEEYDKRCNY